MTENKHLTVDVVKVVLAMLVVVLHSAPISNDDTVNAFVAALTNMAIPLFFCFSGYFYNKLGKFIKRIVLGGFQKQVQS